MAEQRAWRDLLADLHHAFGDQGFAIDTHVKNETSFRDAFEALCAEYNETFAARHLSRLVPSYRRVRNFAAAISQPLRDLHPEALEALVWGSTLSTLRCAFMRKGRPGTIKNLVNYIEKLNLRFPGLTADVGAYPKVRTVQKFLQGLFGEFIFAYLNTIRILENKRPAAILDPLADPELSQFLEKTADKLEEAKAKYEDAVSTAEDIRKDYQMQAGNATADSGIALTASSRTTQPRGPGTFLDFTFLRFLGQGQFGRVEAVQEHATGAVYARKVMPLPPDSQRQQREATILKEVRLMQKLNHDHIAHISFYGPCTDGYQIIMLPVADYNLEEYLLHNCIEANYPPDELQQIRGWFGCLLLALAYAHRQNVLHRDIKLANILIHGKQPYLTDFGLGREFTPGASVSHGPGLRGTPLYWAPECQPNQPRGRKADVFALGCVFAEMLTVSGRRSLAEYADYRSKTVADNYARFIFRASLPASRTWLNNLENQGNTRIKSLLYLQTREMMAEMEEMRPTAKECVKALKGIPSLFCGEYGARQDEGPDAE